jgi:hypothetical protein
VSPADRLALIRERVALARPHVEPALARMRREGVGLPPPERLRPVAFVVHGEVVGRATDFYDALEHLERYPLGAEVVDERVADVEARALAVRCSRYLVPRVGKVTRKAVGL